MQHSTLLTEYTDISQRLEYLVAHSSQMVFITGEDVAVQQGFVEAFLGQQSQRANVAFVHARRNKSEQYYQQLLCEQLQIRIGRGHSLAQAFATRSNKSEPVLIAITAAENIPDDVLRELWDLVLQNRFARNGEQINILMFGDHYWAEDVKSWLPTNNNDKPVLLTTQTLEYDEETEIEGDLDELIANRRALFQERMKNRANGPALRRAPLQIWWVKLALAMVFMASFSSLLIWQYFDVTSAAVKEFTQFLFQSNAATETARKPAELQIDENTGNNSPPEQLDEGLLSSSDNQRVAANFSDAMQRIESSALPPKEGAVTASEVSVATFSKQSADSPSSEFIADITPEQLKQLRDTGTITAVDNTALENASVDNRHGNNSARVSMPNAATSASSNAADTPDQNDALSMSVMDALATLEMMTPATTVVEQAPLNDNPVPTATRSDDADATTENETPLATDVTQNTTTVETDRLAQQRGGELVRAETPSAQSNPQSETSIAGVEPLNEADLRQGEVNDYPVADIVAQTELPSSAESTPTTETPALSSRENTVNAQSGEQNAINYQYHEPLLLELPENSFVLQVSGISSESLLQEYLVDNRLLNKVWVYKTQRYGGDWFVVVHNQNYPSLDDARAAAPEFTAQFPGTAPFAKTIAQVRNEIATLN